MEALTEAKRRMAEAVTAVRREFSSIRTGKASPAILDTVRVEAYGGKMPLKQVATVNAPEPSLLVVQPFDRSLIGDIEKAILTADLGLNPANDGQVVRVPIPPLTEERRKEYVRLLNKMAEEGRVSIRHARRDAKEALKAHVKDGELSDDEGHRQAEELQGLTDEHIQQIEDLLESKKEEVMAV